MECRIRKTGWVGRCGVCLLGLLFLFSCARVTPPPPAPPKYPKPYRVFGKWYQPLPDAKGYSEQGIASWYGKKFHGRKTSSGEIYDMYAMTAAHKTLPLGTYVRVRHLTNNRVVEVQINDRGPFVRGRIIDLSYTAAQKMGIVDAGTAPVEVVALGAPAGETASGRIYVPVDYYSGKFSIQVGAFAIQENAERVKTALTLKYEHVRIMPYDSVSGVFYRVRVGQYTNLVTATENETILVKSGFPDAFTIAE